NQVLVEIETAKSLVELPSPFAGTVTELLAAEGDTVEVGSLIIRVDSTGGAIELQAPWTGDTLGEVAATAASVAQAEGSAEPSGAVLVGYGSKGGHATTRRRRPGAGPTAQPANDAAGAGGAPVAAPRRPTAAPTASVGPVIAKPPIRKLAKDLDVDLAEVTATGPIGDVTRDDVLRQAQQASVFRNLQTPEWPEDREERIP